MKFSERYGISPVRHALQIDEMDMPLRTSLWNALHLCFWPKVGEGYGGGYLSSPGNDSLKDLCQNIWLRFFKRPLETLHDLWSETGNDLRLYFFGCRWFEVYDFIEFVAQYAHRTENGKLFTTACNQFLEKEASAYRFVGKQISRIVAPEEISAVEEALILKSSPITAHLSRSLELLSDRQTPDFRNSIKEAISAVEACVCLATGKADGTLGEVLKKLERGENGLHPALKTAFSSLYGYTSDEGGIRHALMDKDRTTFEDAKFMLVASSAFVSYVNAKFGLVAPAGV